MQFHPHQARVSLCITGALHKEHTHVWEAHRMKVGRHLRRAPCPLQAEERCQHAMKTRQVDCEHV